MLEFIGILRPIWYKLSPRNPNNVAICPPNSNNLAPACVAAAEDWPPNSNNLAAGPASSVRVDAAVDRDDLIRQIRVTQDG